jgi:hypothetical protein
MSLDKHFCMRKTGPNIGYDGFQGASVDPLVVLKRAHPPMPFAWTNPNERELALEVLLGKTHQAFLNKR